MTFEPGARTAWHTHPLGQTLIVTFGLGWVQRWGGPVEEIRPGDLVWFEPGEKHWHGAGPTTAMTHIAIQEALNGKVVDGSGNPWFYGNVAIENGRIARIGKFDPTLGKRVIDAKGMVVSPGFIDLHTHTDVSVLADGNAESKVRQGVTLDVIGESQTVAPLKGGVLEEYKEEAKRRAGVDVDWTTLDGYFRRLGKSGTSINIASSVSPQQVRKVVVGFDDRPATKAEIEQMTQLVRQAMEEGAVNLSTAFTGGGYKLKQVFADTAVRKAYLGDVV